MATGLVLPGGVRPSNLHLPPGARALAVDSDLYDICGRVAEIDKSLHIVLLEGDDKHCFAIMEHCPDMERLVFKVKELDARVLQKLQKIMAMPLQERLALLEKEEHRLAEQEQERELDDLYERVGRPMWTQLEHDGFIQRGVSYPKRGVKPK